MPQRLCARITTPTSLFSTPSSSPSRRVVTSHRCRLSRHNTCQNSCEAPLVPNRQRVCGSSARCAAIASTACGRTCTEITASTGNPTSAGSTSTRKLSARRSTRWESRRCAVGSLTPACSASSARLARPSRIRCATMRDSASVSAAGGCACGASATASGCAWMRHWPARRKGRSTRRASTCSTPSIDGSTRVTTSGMSAASVRVSSAIRSAVPASVTTSWLMSRRASCSATSGTRPERQRTHACSTTPWPMTSGSGSAMTRSASASIRRRMRRATVRSAMPVAAPSSRQDARGSACKAIRQARSVSSSAGIRGLPLLDVTIFINLTFAH